MKPQVTFHRKFAGSAFLALRIFFDLAILAVIPFKILPVKFSISSYLYYGMTLTDAVFCACFLIFPTLTSEGNTYLKCLPFAINSYLSNIVFYAVKSTDLNDESGEKRIPFIVAFNILALLMYGGMACPLNLAWMETFKPFSIVVMRRKASIVAVASSK